MVFASRRQSDALSTFIASLADMPWLVHIGDRDQAWIVADGLLDAWDGWGAEMLAAWKPETTRLEKMAVRELGDAGLDEVFSKVSNAVDAPLRAAMDQYFERRSTDKTGAERGLWPEWLDAMKRDLSWAAVETVVNHLGFFTGLLHYYRLGRWPCAWEDGDRNKRVVVL